MCGQLSMRCWYDKVSLRPARAGAVRHPLALDCVRRTLGRRAPSQLVWKYRPVGASLCGCPGVAVGEPSLGQLGRQGDSSGGRCPREEDQMPLVLGVQRSSLGAGARVSWGGDNTTADGCLQSHLGSKGAWRGGGVCCLLSETLVVCVFCEALLCGRWARASILREVLTVQSGL